MITSIIILTYNKLEYTKLCIESIRKYTDKNNYEIIVVDNGSTDGTIQWLNNQNDIKTIFNKENRGFPKGCNQGIKISQGDNILLLNNDVIVTPNWLSNLNKCLYSSKCIGAVGAVTNMCSYHQQINVSYYNVNGIEKFAEEYNISNKDKWEERLKLIGFCMLIKREVIEQVGLLDERFTPGNFEDDDYSLRVIKAGYRLVLCKDTFIHHFGNVTFNDNTEAFYEIARTNQKKFEGKWGFSWEHCKSINCEIIQLINTPKSQAFNVLEIGCGCGANLVQIKNVFKNANLYGIESNRNAYDISKAFANVIVGSIENCELSYEESFFDYIIFSGILEKLKEPEKVLERVRKYLKSDGKVLVSNFNISFDRDK